MKKKGFTLIELLAVIVILAIIALIAIPLVLKYIQTSRDEARLRSAENYLDAVEKAVVNQNMQGKKFNPYVCNVKDEKLYCDGTLLDVSIKGVKPDNSSVITFNNGKIDRVKLLYEDKIIVDNEKDILVYSEDIEILPAGVYDDDNSLLASWDELVNKYGLDIEAKYNVSSCKKSGAMYAVLNNNPNLSSATKVIVKDGITKIGNSAFYGCKNLKKIKLPEGVTNIGNYAFGSNEAVEKIDVPNTVSSIGSFAFSGCKNLQVINIPEGVTTIANGAFNGCSSLKNLVLPTTLKTIGMMAFSACKSLEEAIINDGVTSIGLGAFNACENLENIVIPESVTSIGNQAFGYSKKLKEVVIPKNVRSIGKGVFNGCQNLETIVVDKENSTYNDNGSSDMIIETATNKLITGTKNGSIPDDIISIGESAFAGLGLTNINIPDSVTSIGAGAFEKNELTSVQISKNVTNIGGNVFQSCKNLEKIIVDDENTVYDSRDNSNAIIDTSTNTLIAGCKNTVIPVSVIAIGNYAFNSLDDLNNIIIPNNLTTIGFAAFAGSGLTSIVIPDSVTSIGDGAFNGCKNLETVTISKNVTSMTASMFAGTDNLKTIYYKGTATGAPWGATNATVISDY